MLDVCALLLPLLAALVVVLALPAAAAPSGQPADAAAPPAESNLNIVAAAVRVTGARCQHPRSIEPDAAASLADRPAWIIACESGRFRVIFEGDTGPRVTPLD